MTGLRVYRHETAAQEILEPANRIQRRHGCVTQAFITEYPHFCRGIESFLDLIFRITGFFHVAVAVALFHGALHDRLNFFGREVGGKGGVGFILLLFEEPCLQVLHVFAYCLFRVLLHARIDGCIDLQTVLVEVVMRTVGLGEFIAETV